MTLSEPIKPGLQSWYFLFGADAERVWLEYLVECAVPEVDLTDPQASE